jgi:three-Cys-motif partner protein
LAIHHQLFGSDWTEKKLKCLQKYLAAYNAALKRQPFERIYIDAFAGSGYRRDKKSDNLFKKDELLLRNSYFSGSAKISLGIEPGFTKYFFIDIDEENIESLNKLKIEFPDKDITNIHGDANIEVKRLCKSINWQKTRGVIFLDPFGMQVNWITLEEIAMTKALDCWILVPIGVAINRMITKNHQPPKQWEESLTRVLGTDKWKRSFYKTDPQLPLFNGEHEDRLIKQTSFDDIGNYFLNRMKQIFSGVIEEPLYLRNSTGVPLYALYFGVSNPYENAKNLALRIASYIIGKEK